MDATIIAAGLVVGAIIGFVILKFMFGATHAQDQVEAPAPTRQASTGGLEEVAALTRQGNKIEAIKRYRELTGTGLLEAKQYVEKLAAGSAPEPVQLQNLSPAGQEQALEEIRALMRANQKIQAIKRYREVYHVGLAEAKDAVERL